MNPSSSNRKKKQWREEKERLLKMTLEEKRKTYVRDVVPLKEIISWMEELKSKCQGDGASDDSVKTPSQVAEPYSEEGVPTNRSLSEKVSLYKGDITLLELDAIVNAANSSLLGGGGVDGCIHRAAGPCLVAECRSLNGCETGEAKITCGYDLPAKYVIHTVGPMARGHINDTHKEDLASCYRSSLRLVKENSIRSVAFPCISTGIYGFPNEPAAKIALDTIKDWLQENQSEVDRIIFCVFLDTDYKIYKRKLSEIFPLDEDVEEDTNEEIESSKLKAQSPPSKKPKGKKLDSSDNESDGENSSEEKELDGEKEIVEEKEWAEKDIPEEKDGTEKEITEEKKKMVEMEGQSQGADEERPTPEAPPTADSIDSCQNKELLRDSEEPQEKLGDQSMDVQEQPEGQDDDDLKAEMKTLPDSQCSYMEIEDESSNHEEEADNDQYLLANEHQVEDSAEDKEKPSSEHSDSQEYLDAENELNLNSDAEMNSQLEPTQNPPQEQLIGEQEEKKEQ